ncbi:MAG: hypothetical protein CSA70_05770 [Rhodobacterales bacterium]|nr:MAG: hypothetical protein CSA70_05770 [Rhodobacterales bacterium]
MSKMIEAFFDAWAETDSDLRAAALRGVMAESFVYLGLHPNDPITDANALTGCVGTGALV